MNRGANKYGTITHAILSLVQALHINKLFRYKLRTATHPDVLRQHISYFEKSVRFPGGTR